MKSTPDQTIAMEQNKILQAIFRKDANDKKKEEEMSGLESEESDDKKKEKKRGRTQALRGYQLVSNLYARNRKGMNQARKIKGRQK